MTKIKLCVIYNYAQHYRTGIFKLISNEFDTDFCFGDSMGDVKKLDYSLLSGDVREVHVVSKFGFSYQRGLLHLLKKDYSSYVILGETRSISTWLFLLLSVFHREKKYFLWTHGWYGKESLLEKLLKKVMYRLPNGGLFLYGNRARELMISEGFNPEKLFVIHNSLDYEVQLPIRQSLQPSPIYQNHFNNTNKNIVFIGRLTKVKRLDMLIEAILLLKKRGLMINVTFVGDGTERKKMEQMVEEKGIKEQVWFFGASYDEKNNAKMIYNADLCVSPGNVGLTAMHSLVYGTPVITHDDFRYQMPEFEAIKKGITGDFYQYGSVVSLADTILKWLADNENNRERVKKDCFMEIDHFWTPYYQMKVLKENLC